MNRQYDFEDIEDYLSGNMAESDKIAFETALEQDPELVARLEALRAEAQLSKLLRRQHILDKFCPSIVCIRSSILTESTKTK